MVHVIGLVSDSQFVLMTNCILCNTEKGINGACRYGDCSSVAEHALVVKTSCPRFISQQLLLSCCLIVILQ